MKDIVRQCLTGKKTLSEIVEILKPYDQSADVPIQHMYGQNLLCRQATYPKGMIVVGRVHKYDHVFMIVSGKMTVWTGSERKLLVGPCMFESKAGVRRLGYAHTEVVCMNMHGLEEGQKVDIENVEEALTVADEEEYAIYIGTLPTPVSEKGIGSENGQPETPLLGAFEMA